MYFQLDQVSLGKLLVCDDIVSPGEPHLVTVAPSLTGRCREDVAAGIVSIVDCLR